MPSRAYYELYIGSRYAVSLVLCILFAISDARYFRRLAGASNSGSLARGLIRLAQRIEDELAARALVVGAVSELIWVHGE